MNYELKTVWHINVDKSWRSDLLLLVWVGFFWVYLADKDLENTKQILYEIYAEDLKDLLVIKTKLLDVEF